MVTSTLKSSKDSSTDTTFPLNYWPLHPTPHPHSTPHPHTANISTPPHPLTPLTHSLPLHHRLRCPYTTDILCPHITDTFGHSLPLHHWLFYPYNTDTTPYIIDTFTPPPPPGLTTDPFLSQITDVFSVFLAGCASWFASLIYPSCAPAKRRRAWRQQHRLLHTADCDLTRTGLVTCTQLWPSAQWRCVQDRIGCKCHPMPPGGKWS